MYAHICVYIYIYIYYVYRGCGREGACPSCQEHSRFNTMPCFPTRSLARPSIPDLSDSRAKRVFVAEGAICLSGANICVYIYTYMCIYVCIYIYTHMQL